MSEPSLHPALVPYQGKITSAANAAKLVRPGQHVFVGTACATPRTLVAALESLPYAGKKNMINLTRNCCDNVNTERDEETMHVTMIFLIESARDPRRGASIRPPVRRDGANPWFFAEEQRP